MMKIVRTVEGEQLFPQSEYMRANANGRPTFSLTERLDRFVLRSYSSKSLSYITNLMGKASPSDTAIIDEDCDEDFDVEE